MLGRTTIVIAHRLSTIRARTASWCSSTAASSRRARTPRWWRAGGVYRRLFEHQAMVPALDPSALDQAGV